jgi:hypothetical protein
MHVYTCMMQLHKSIEKCHTCMMCRQPAMQCAALARGCYHRGSYWQHIHLNLPTPSRVYRYVLGSTGDNGLSIRTSWGMPGGTVVSKAARVRQKRQMAPSAGRCTTPLPVYPPTQCETSVTGSRCEGACTAAHATSQTCKVAPLLTSPTCNSQ